MNKNFKESSNTIRRSQQYVVGAPLLISHTPLTDACRFVTRQGCQDWLHPAAQKSSGPTEISRKEKRASSIVISRIYNEMIRNEKRYSFECRLINMHFREFYIVYLLIKLCTSPFCRFFFYSIFQILFCIIIIK